MDTHERGGEGIKRSYTEGIEEVSGLPGLFYSVAGPAMGLALAFTHDSRVTPAP